MRNRTLFAAVTAAAVLAGGAALAQGWGYGYGPGQGPGPGYGYGQAPMGQQGMMMGPGQGYRHGHGMGMMGRQGMQGQPCPRFGGAAVEVTPETVEQRLQQRLARRGNDRLTVGEVTEAEDGTITAEIVTKAEGALVDKFAFDPDTGRMQRLP